MSAPVVDSSGARCARCAAPLSSPGARCEACDPAVAGRPAASRFRWVILILVFFAITVNYVDRLVMAVLGPDLKARFQINDQTYGYIGSAFALAYAGGQLIAGRWLDRVGTRVGFAVALAAWSLSAMAHALARGAWGFVACRALLGFAESPAFPAAAKTLAEWFPRRERAFAFGFVNAGTNMGAILAPLVVPWVAVNFGWQWAFIGTGVIGLFWLLFWIPLYRRPEEHPRVSAAELNLIRSDPAEPPTPVPWGKLLTYKQAWAFVVGKFLTDSMWWFYMTWFPIFLDRQYKLDLRTIGLPLVAVYVMADLGSISGGWLSSWLLRRGASVNAARKTALLISALGVLPMIGAQRPMDLWWAVGILGLATAAHQSFSSNLYTLVSDMFPRRTVASVAGLGGAGGYLGASLFQLLVGYWVETHKSYTVPFICAGLAYLVALAVIHLLAPRLQPALESDPPVSRAGTSA